MRPQENIVRLIVAKHIDILEVARLASGIGVHIQIFDDLNLLDLVMDIIGFPSGDTEFDREDLKKGEWDLGKGDIDVFVENLYNEFDVLLLSKPHLFVKK